MILKDKIMGKYVSLRSVLESDAEVTTKLRQDVEKTKFLHSVSPDVERQRKWIKEQNLMLDDYFFLVEDLDGVAIGTMGISQIKDQKGYTGRLLMYGNAFQSYEAYMLLIDFGFNELNLVEQHGETDITNTSAMRFSQMFGFKYGSSTFDPELNRHKADCTLNRQDFEIAKEHLQKLIYR